MGWLTRTPHTSPAAATLARAAVSAEELIALRLPARQLTLASGLAVSAAQAGTHHSRFRGRGVDYQESRSYQPGDDIRSMDWRVMARRNEPHTKVFQEERERPVWLLVDLSPSLFFGTRRAFKSVIAARVATLLAWAAVRHGDRVGALIGSGQQLKPAGGRRGVMRLIRALIAATDPEPGLRGEAQPEPFAELLARLRRTLRPGSLVFVLSDFYGLDGECEQHLSQLRRHNDVVAVQINDVLELSLPPAGRYGVSDGEKSGFLDTSSTAGRHAYSEFFTDHQRRIDDLLRRCMTPQLRLSTTDDLDLVTTLRRGLSTLSVPPTADPVPLTNKEAA